MVNADDVALAVLARYRKLPGKGDYMTHITWRKFPVRRKMT